MSKAKRNRLIILASILVVFSLAAFFVSRYEQKKEVISNTDATIVSVSADSVTALSWEYKDSALSFHKDEVWLWDEDESFPADEEKINSLLSLFEDFTASFIIEDVDDYSQYGLKEPAGVIKITAEDAEYEISLGSFSNMDQERYFSVGDGNVYLATKDPADDFNLQIEDMIKDDVIPKLTGAIELSFSGALDEVILYEENSAKTYGAGDVYFLEDKPLDTVNVTSYLTTIQSLSTDEYASYNVSDEELEEFGLASPELSVTVCYPVETESEDSNDETTVTEYYELTVSVGRNKTELEEGAESEEEDAYDDISAYFRIDDSQIVYTLSSSDYNSLISANYNDLRHKEIFTADFDEVTGIDITLEDAAYSLYTVEEADEDDEDEVKTVWHYIEDDELDISTFKSKLTALKAYSFTDEEPELKEEINLVIHLSNENFDKAEIVLYRYDGEYCLAVVDGETVGLVTRSSVVNLIEAVNAIILG